MNFVIPYREHSFHTTLSENDVRAAVEKHAHLGQWDGMLFKSKPYYGELSKGHFALRASGRFKKHSHAPTLLAWLEPDGHGLHVTLSLRPHPLLVALAILFVGSSAFFLMVNVWAFFGTWDISPAVMSSFILVLLAGVFALPYQLSAEKTLRFWIQELKLQAR